MRVLQALQLVGQLVERLIGDLRRVHHVIQVFMPPDFRAQFLNALRIVLLVAL